MKLIKIDIKSLNKHCFELNVINDMVHIIICGTKDYNIGTIFYIKKSGNDDIYTNIEDISYSSYLSMKLGRIYIYKEGNDYFLGDFNAKPLYLVSDKAEYFISAIFNINEMGIVSHENSIIVKKGYKKFDCGVNSIQEFYDHYMREPVTAGIMKIKKYDDIIFVFH